MQQFIQDLKKDKNTNNPNKTENDAAITIQKIWRGHQVRKEIEDQNNAAITIQKTWRGHSTRKNGKYNSKTNKRSQHKNKKSFNPKPTHKLYVSMNEDVDILKSQLIKLGKDNNQMKQAIIRYQEEIECYQQLTAKLQSMIAYKDNKIASLRANVTKLDAKLDEIVNVRESTLKQSKHQHVQRKNNPRINQRDHKISNLKRQQKSLEIQEQNAKSALKAHKQLKAALNEQIFLMQQGTNNDRSIYNKQISPQT